MEDRKDAIHERWVQRTEEAYRRMFEGKSQEELVTLSQREKMAALIAKELAATWQGTVDLGGKPLRIIVTMTNHPDGTATGTVMSPEAGGIDIPIAIAQQSDTVTLEVPAVGASFAGVINADNTELTGTWTQGPAALPLVLKRQDK